jgi:hypothetical protein
MKFFLYISFLVFTLGALILAILYRMYDPEEEDKLK